MRRRPALAVLGLTVVSVLATACSGSGGDLSTDPVAGGSELSPSATSAATSQPTPGASASAAPSPSASPSATVAASPAAPAYDVAAVQRALTDGKYYVAAIDGRPGPALRSAVMAFQKVNGLGIDGTVGPATLAALASPATPVLKGSSPATRVEVDLTRQVLYVVKDGVITRILPVSSGNGASYQQKNGSTARSLTPVGYYKIERRIVGERKADLGSLYDPQYFYRGWAIHGSNSVPAGPASHGCVRVTRPDAKYLLDVLNNGMTVFLYGGSHTFAAGSAAPGTDSPTGDDPTEAPAASPAATAAPSPQPSSAPSTAPSAPAASPSASAPAASPSASAPAASASPSTPAASPAR